MAPMIDHISVGVRDIARARRFYDAVLGTLGYRCMTDTGRTLGYGRDDAAFWVVVSERPVPPDPVSGLHVCFTASCRTAVEAFHAAALREGGQDNGRPGLRPEYGPGYYAAFAIDPEGYRLEAYCGTP